MKVSYFPGCSLESTAAEFDDSIKEVFKLLNIELAEIEDWNCCGATSAHALNNKLALSLPARNLIIASQDSDRVFVPCAACYSRMKHSEQKLTEDADFQKEIENNVGMEYKNHVEVMNFLDYFADKLDLIKASVKKPLTGLKVVCYYGCLLTRPPKITGQGDFEDPQSMDNIVRAVGADAIQWSFKTDCCGNSLSITKTEIVVNLISRLYKMAKECGADAIITACPLCMTNLDTRQSEAAKLCGEEFNIPIIYISELIAAAFGSDRMNDFWKKHFINPTGLFEK